MGGSGAGRVTGASTGGGNASQMAARGGAETHALTIGQMPSHDHGGSVSAVPDHTHSVTDQTGANTDGLREYGHQHSGSAQTGPAGGHDHTIPAQGGGQAHSTMPPWFSLNLLIKV